LRDYHKSFSIVWVGPVDLEIFVSRVCISAAHEILRQLGIWKFGSLKADRVENLEADRVENLAAVRVENLAAVCVENLEAVRVENLEAVSVENLEADRVENLELLFGNEVEGG